MKNFFLGSVLRPWVRKMIVGQFLCLKYTKYQHHFVLFVRMVVEIFVLSHLIFLRNSDALIHEICLPSKYQ